MALDIADAGLPEGGKYRGAFDEGHDALLLLLMQLGQQCLQGFLVLLAGEVLGVGAVDLDELEALGGVRNYPVRLKCALLAWETFSAAMSKN